MSFTTEVIEELTASELSKTCCRKAMLFGLFFGASLEEGRTVRAELKNEKAAELAVEILAKQFSADAYVEEVSHAGRRLYSVRVTSKAITIFLQLLDNEASDKALSEIVGFRCNFCSRAFLCGAFIALGTVNDPKKCYHLEFTMRGAARSRKLSDFLEEVNFPPKTVGRGERIGIYYKKNMAILDLLYYFGAKKSAFTFSDACIEHDIRNKENRATNCTTKNISRSLEVSQRQVDAISALEKKGLLSMLDSELQYTAKMRLENALASLNELAALHTPPITKSTLNRRLTKIMDFSAKCNKNVTELK